MTFLLLFLAMATIAPYLGRKLAYRFALLFVVMAFASIWIMPWVMAHAPPHTI